MTILYQLGLNQTIYYQLVFFVISALFMWRFLFIPYLRIMEYRKKQTSGTTEQAAHLVAATEQLAMDYEGKIRSQNERMNEVFDELKRQGVEEEERLLSEARARAAQILEQTQSQITKDLAIARADLEKQIPQLASTIASKVLGREVAG